VSTFVNLTLNAIIIHNASYTFWHFARVVWNFRLSLALTCRSIPLQERSRAVAVVFGGLSFGSVLGLLFAPPIIQNLGWESVFYIFGLLGIIWCIGFESLKGKQLGSNKGLNLGQSSTGSNGLASSAVSSESSDSSLEDLQNSLKVVFYQLRSRYLNLFLKYLSRDQITKLLSSSDINDIQNNQWKSNV